MRIAIAALTVATGCAHPSSPATSPSATSPPITTTTAASAWSALAAHHHDVFLRGGGAECHRLAIGPNGLVRAADPARHRPRLAFTLAAEANGDVELRSVPPAAAAPVLDCRITFTSSREVPIGRGFAIPPASEREMPGEELVIFDEHDCLAEPPPDGRAVDCLRGVLDSTSELPDAVADRLAPYNSLYRLKDGQCETLPLRTGGGFDVRYTGYSYDVHWWTADEPHEELDSVVQVAADQVLLGGQPAYVDRCR